MGTVPTTLTYVTGQVLTAAQLNGNPGATWGAFVLGKPCGEVRQTAAQTFTTAVDAAFTFDAEDNDPDNAHSTVTNTTRIIPQTPGRYRIEGGGAWVANNAGDRHVYAKSNGTTVINGSGASGIAAAVFVLALGIRAKTMSCNGTTDYFEIVGGQTSGGNLNSAVTTWQQPSCTWEWISQN